MATAQVNARIDANVKALGDRALSSIGQSPTSAVRALWRFAGDNGGDDQRLRALFATLEGERGADVSDAEASRVQRALEGPLIFERALEEMGVSSSNYKPAAMTDDELLEQAYFDKMAERGTLR